MSGVKHYAGIIRASARPAVFVELALESSEFFLDAASVAAEELQVIISFAYGGAGIVILGGQGTEVGYIIAIQTGSAF